MTRTVITTMVMSDEHTLSPVSDAAAALVDVATTHQMALGGQALPIEVLFLALSAVVSRLRMSPVDFSEAVGAYVGMRCEDPEVVDLLLETMRVSAAGAAGATVVDRAKLS